MEKEHISFGRELPYNSLQSIDSQDFTKELGSLLVHISHPSLTVFLEYLLQHGKYINLSSELTLPMLESYCS